MKLLKKTSEKELYNINLNQNKNANPTNRAHDPLDN